MDIQRELEKELRRLQVKWGFCGEYKVVWEPIVKEEHLPFDKNAELKGEVNKLNHTLLVYDSEIEEALHTLRHEFFEACFDTLISPYVEIYNYIQRGYEKAFMQTQYCHKESFIEKFVQKEEGENKK